MIQPDDMPGAAPQQQPSPVLPQVIWKYPPKLVARQAVSFHEPGQLLHLGLDGEGVMCAWSTAFPGGEPRERILHIVGTGHPIPNPPGKRLQFMRSITQAPFVWHIFEELELGGGMGNVSALATVISVGKPLHLVPVPQ